jgi:hypothetical protein
MEFLPMSEIAAHYKGIFIFSSCRNRHGIRAKIRVGPPVPLPIFMGMQNIVAPLATQASE